MNAGSSGLNAIVVATEPCRCGAAPVSVLALCRSSSARQRCTAEASNSSLGSTNMVKWSPGMSTVDSSPRSTSSQPLAGLSSGRAVLRCGFITGGNPPVALTRVTFRSDGRGWYRTLASRLAWYTRSMLVMCSSTGSEPFAPRNRPSRSFCSDTASDGSISTPAGPPEANASRFIVNSSSRAATSSTGGSG